MVYKVRLVSFPNTAAEDKVYRDLEVAKAVAQSTGFDACVEGFSEQGELGYMLCYSVISGWSQ